MTESHEGLVDVVLPGGEGLVRYQNNNILIPNTVEGDQIQFRIMQKRRGALRGELLEVIKPSKDRIQAPCPASTECGGCALQSMSQTSQSALKNTWVKQAFLEFISPDTEVSLLDASLYEFSGRRRVRWFVENGRLGFYKRASHQIIHSYECLVLTTGLNEMRKQLEAILSQFPQVVESIQATELHHGTHIIFESKSKIDNVNLPEFRTQDNVQYWWRQLETPSIKPLNRPIIPLFDRISLLPYLEKDLDIQIGPNDFIQGHAQGNQSLIQQILAWSQGSTRIVDLFSGCGNLSLPLAAANGATIVGAEANVNSVQAANNNAKRLQLNATYHTVDLFGNFDIEPFIGADTLIIDPPRKGAKRICNMIHQFFPKQIIMVNCDAASGARDAKALQESGFRLKALRPLDLFPYTGHVEVMSLWTR